jgi:hypothetical protein
MHRFAQSRQADLQGAIALLRQSVTFGFAERRNKAIAPYDRWRQAPFAENEREVALSADVLHAIQLHVTGALVGRNCFIAPIPILTKPQVELDRGGIRSRNATIHSANASRDETLAHA